MRTLFFILFWGMLFFIITRAIKDRRGKHQDFGGPLKPDRDAPADPWAHVWQADKAPGRYTAQQTRSESGETPGSIPGEKTGDPPVVSPEGANPARPHREAGVLDPTPPGAVGGDAATASDAAVPPEGGDIPRSSPVFVGSEAFSPAPDWSRREQEGRGFSPVEEAVSPPEVSSVPPVVEQPSREPVRGSHIGYLPLPGAGGK